VTFASLLIRDRELADSLADGFHALWRKAMRSFHDARYPTRNRDRRRVLTRINTRRQRDPVAGMLTKTTLYVDE
jgi:hypothetical protein